MYILRKTISVPPPADFANYSPSELFRFFFQLGRWTEDSFSDDLQNFTRGKLVSTVTISKWKNRDVVPARYSGPLLKLIEKSVDTGLSQDWVRAFETVWAHRSSGREVKAGFDDPVSRAKMIIAQHKKWIQYLYNSCEHEDAAAAIDLYVPLQIYDADGPNHTPLDVEDLLENSELTSWTLISGGPGAGKSMTALHIANMLHGENLTPIYLRGSRLSNIDIDVTEPGQMITDSFSFRSFLKHFRASASQTGYLILDGVDEIGLASQASLGPLTQILSELVAEQAACAAHGKALKIIILGRDAHIQAVIKHTPLNDYKHFKIMALDGSYPDLERHSDGLKGEDFRELWWAKYLAATGNMTDPSLPDFLTTEYDDFFEFGTDPLLATLICKAALQGETQEAAPQLPHERVNALTYMSNKNAIYKTIFDQLLSSNRHPIRSDHILNALQHIAIQMWQNGEHKTVALDKVYRNIQDENIKAVFRALNLSEAASDASPDLLATAFYYRVNFDETTPSQNNFEFTHKTFAEYLISNCLFDAFTQLITTLGDHVAFETALQQWIHISHSGRHDPSLGDFCQKEAALRFDTLSNLDFDQALQIIKEHLNGAHFTDPKTASIAHIQSSASLLFFIWSCLNLERHKQTGQSYKLSQKDSAFNLHDLKSIQAPNGLDISTGTRLEPILKHPSFLTQSLSALTVRAVDLSQLSLSLGHMECTSFDETSFAMTHWSHVKTSKSRFSRSIFQQAIFHQWRVLESDFNMCLFHGARFQSANFSNCHFKGTYFSQCHFSEIDFTTCHWEDVIFDRCIFTDCVFSSKKTVSMPASIDFRYCTLMEADQNQTSQIKNYTLTSGIGEIL